MEEKKTGLWKALTNKDKYLLHNKELKEKLYVIIFESDTPKGVIRCLSDRFYHYECSGGHPESVVTFSDHFRLALQILEYVFTAFLLSSIWCVFIVRRSRRNIFSAFSVLSICWQPCRCIWGSFYQCTLFTYYPDIPPDPRFSCVQAV